MTGLRAALGARRDAVAGAVVSIVGLYVFGLVVVDGFSVPGPVVVLGVIIGMTYGILAVGLVLVYRSSRIINFAHGEIGAFAASLFGVWVASRSIDGLGLPYWLMLPAAMAVGAAMSVAVEALAVRRLRDAPKVMSLVVTLGVGSFLLLLSLSVNTIVRNGAQYPKPPGMPTFHLGSLTITPEYSTMLIATPALVAALGLFLRRTRVGIGLRAASDNQDAALMAGIPAGRMSAIAWGIAGAISAYAAILQFPQKGFVVTGAALGPGLLVRALLAAVVARFTSLPTAFLFGIVVGVIEQVAFWNTGSNGPPEVIMFLTLLVVLLLQARQGTREADRDAWVQIRPWAQVPEAWRSIRSIRWAGPVGVGVGGVAIVLAGLSTNRASLAFTLVVGYSLVGLSIYVVTGLSGQLSLGQFALAGVGAVASYRFVDDVLRSVPLGIVVGGVAGALVSILIGLPALRIRGMLLAVTTLSFGVAAQAWLFQQDWTFGAGVEPADLVIFDEPVRTSRAYFLFSLPFLVGALWLVRNVATRGYGRTLRAVRDNEDAARAFGISATAKKLASFALAGFLAGAGGALYGHSLPILTAQSFTADKSVTAVAITLIGGLSLLVGPVLGALYLLALPVLVELDEIGLAVSTLGWVVLILYFPGGLAQAFQPTRDRVLSWLAARAGQAAVEPGAEGTEGSAPLARAAGADVSRIHTLAREAPPADGSDGAPLLVVTDLVKTFGGIRAVDGVSLTVERGETLGILGANGAGKTTLFELIGGFLPPDSGSVAFEGTDITSLPPERRARLGLVRSFQDARLFPTLTVTETVTLALDRMRPNTLWGSASAWPAEVRSDREKAALAGELIDALGLSPWRDRAVAELSTGTRRITELAAVAALRPRLLLLDEPSSGVAQRETEALGALIDRLKSLLSMTLVVIEHDIALMMEISDRVIAMETGRVIADGTPEAVQHDPLVIASYLGSSQVAVQRSGPVPA